MLGMQGSTMIHRKRRCCLFLFVATFVSACSLLFSPRDMRVAFSDYLTQRDAEARRLLQDANVKSSSASDTRMAKSVKESKKSEREKYQVPIFWDDGEFMEDEAFVRHDKIVRRMDEVVKEKSGEQQRNNGTNVEPSVVLRVGLQDKPMGNDQTMAVLDYKLSQFQTVKYSSNKSESVRSQSGEKDEGSEEATSRVLPVHLIIVTQRRSGSSFLGQIFNQNPWVFFHFEPLKLLEQRKGVYPNASSLLGNILKCRFDRTPYLTDMYNNETLHRMSSKVLCSPPLCQTNVDYNHMKSSYVKKCEPLNIESVTSVCNVYPHKVVKLIRLYSIESLRPLLQDKDLNVKIIHLLRDPRGTLSSRSKEHPDTTKPLTLGKSLDHNAAYICRRMRYNFKFVHQNQRLLQDRYLRVRYEDIASDPAGWTRTLYKFAGMGDVPVDVYNWIQENTRESTLREVKDVYSTHRNSSANAQAWRHYVDFPVVQEIQKHCSDVLSEARYVAVKQASDMTRTDLSFVASIT